MHCQKPAALIELSGISNDLRCIALWQLLHSQKSKVESKEYCLYETEVFGCSLFLNTLKAKASLDFQMSERAFATSVGYNMNFQLQLQPGVVPSIIPRTKK